MNKTHIMFLIGEERIGLTTDQANTLMQALGSGNSPKFVQVGEEMYAVHQIRSIVKVKEPTVNIGSGKTMIRLSPPKCEWCHTEYNGAWSQHASICEKNPYKKEAKKLLASTKTE